MPNYVNKVERPNCISNSAATSCGREENRISVMSGVYVSAVVIVDALETVKDTDIHKQSMSVCVYSGLIGLFFLDTDCYKLALVWFLKRKMMSR